MEVVSSLNQLMILANHTLKDVSVINALEQSKRFLCGRGWTVYTEEGDIIVLVDTNILYTDVVGILSKDTWSDETYGPVLHKEWRVDFCSNTHVIKEWYREFDSAYCCYYTPTEFTYPILTPKIQKFEVPGEKEHMLIGWIHEFTTAVTTLDKTKMCGPYPDFTSHVVTNLSKKYSDGVRMLVTELGHAQRSYIATFGVS